MLWGSAEGRGKSGAGAQLMTLQPPKWPENRIYRHFPSKAQQLKKTMKNRRW
jgi:hypothetical protein